MHDNITKYYKRLAGASALSYRTGARWARAFREGRDNMSNMSRSGHPPESGEDV